MRIGRRAEREGLSYRQMRKRLDDKAFSRRQKVIQNAQSLSLFSVPWKLHQSSFWQQRMKCGFLTGDGVLQEVQL